MYISGKVKFVVKPFETAVKAEVTEEVTKEKRRLQYIGYGPEAQSFEQP